MPKLRKQRKRKTYRYNVNRKRLRNKIQSKGKISCKEVREAWEPGKSIQTNLQNMGLSSDPNKTIKIPMNNWVYIDWIEKEHTEKIVPSKSYVAETLEMEAKAPRERAFRLPNSQVEWITFLMDKYGTDYKAMARDKKNYNQETWKQLRAKIRLFKGIPEQYSKYLEERSLDIEVVRNNDSVISDDEL